MKKLLFIIVAVLFMNCEKEPSVVVEENNQTLLTGNWNFNYKVVNGEEIGDGCDKQTIMRFNDNPTLLKRYYDFMDKECKEFPERDIDVDSDSKYIWIDGWKYEYSVSESSLIMWYTTYNPDGSSIDVKEVWRRFY